ncbi:DNA polymerase IV [Robiginitalea aurantiaca]|uniref:DNA polymerase IV n=1 Tax=Robiginitalea aurantiaca TaxID=3056915 RepID=A0ABT7WE86_9FLAO|nr:DNA polymerase IV [Robiginitalea aurantiaca]MDM9631230.1 DNA polymerase IV [Robiginitalea aurantiaca]
METEVPLRKIIHVDMDAFYASVEQKDDPSLKGKPLAVGGGSKRGVVAAASYEARTYGVRSAMSGYLAKQKCPDLIFVKPRFERYKEISLQIREIFREYTDLVEPLSLDEAYLDVTENKTGIPSATLIAREIRDQIYTKTGLTASAGISINKFIAKIASDLNKPNGQKTIPPEAVPQFLQALEIRKFYGVGRVTAEKMHNLGIFTGSDLLRKTPEFLETHFGKSGRHYYQVVRGIHLSPVQPRRSPKSVGAERTFSENLSSEVFMLDRLSAIAAELESRLKPKKRAGKTITLKIKYSDFRLHTRSKTLPYYISTASMVLEIAKELLYQEPLQNSVRLLGISLSNLNTEKTTNEPAENAVQVQLKFDF